MEMYLEYYQPRAAFALLLTGQTFHACRCRCAKTIILCSASPEEQIAKLAHLTGQEVCVVPAGLEMVFQC
jgi:hypothetical protein